MVEFPKNHVITGIAVGELRIKRVGVSPTIMAKLVFLDDRGLSFGSSLLSSGFSTKTQRLLDAVFQSMEEDAAQIMSSGDPASGDRRIPARDDISLTDFPDEADEEPYR